MSVPTGAEAGAPANLVAITSPDMFTGLMQEDLNRVTVLNFWAPWAQPCEPMIAAVAQMAPRYPHVLFMSIEAEEQPDVSESFDIEAVPTVVLLRGHTLLAKLTGGQVQAVEQALRTHAGGHAGAGLAQSRAAPQAAPATYVPAGGAAAAGAEPVDDPARPHALPAHLQGAQEAPADTERRCRELMTRSKVMLFMKGQPNMPRCGFSQKTVALLREQHVDFDFYDILSDEHVRQTLKVLNDWPTFPQIIVHGELIGGLDILKEMIASGEFQALVGAAAP
ncbi:Similar to S.cerevisiae protein GRX4 (Glutathione-dependent oxidoreductase) [Malassezia sympodialis ATCC 42132]|uniref:Similar to S.cerevisiae protein GRX4 (Glutathione-dependent oxidoreductase) n=1 Tax=Malassezia sympodialis (strain ATCC 42132) TaxID=1230383 RepID=A0A1M8A908_MALS4|nr:Similar to S.cerevisiae protein GRX4 (Glutathione-dependent oxidoreductase) [Malassezia sympodialis ATCC 42132]